MKDKQFIVTIEKNSDGTFIAYNVDESPYTLIGRGATVKEAKADFANSMQEAKAKPIPFCRLLLCLASISLRCLNIILC